MPTFEYSALSASGKTMSGVIDADSKAVANNKLRSRGLYPTKIRESRKETAAAASGGQTKRILFSRIRPTEIAILTRQLATLIGSGFPLVSALSTLIPQSQSPAMKRILSQVKDAVEEGSSFAEALSYHPSVFTPIFVNMVQAGESSGTLELVLERLATFTENQQIQMVKIRSALTYPILMATMGGLILILLLTYIVPGITGMFADMNRALPLPTRILIGVSGVFKSYWWLILIVLLSIPAGIRQVRKNPGGRTKTDALLLKLPMLGTLVQKIAVSRFSRTLGSLLHNGVPILTALQIVKNIVGSLPFETAIGKAARDVEQGTGLGAALSPSGVFPGIAIQMIQVGEQSGNLEKMLDKVADIYDNEVESTISALMSILEPVIIMVMGVVVGFIVLSICLPIFEMNQLVM